MGLSVAHQLAEKGANIIIVARDADRLRESIIHISVLATLISFTAISNISSIITRTKTHAIQRSAISPQTQRFHHISADLINAAESTRVIAEATAWNGDAPPDIIWCCAGSAHPTLFIDTPLEQLQHMMDSNYFTSAYMAHAALTTWLQPKDSSSNIESVHAKGTTKHPIPPPSPPRHLIFTASFVSFYSFTGFAPYTPSKVALRSLCDTISQEMNLYAGANPSEPRVRVHTVFPATMPTESLEAENRVKTDVTRMLEEGDTVLTPYQVAQRSIAGLERGEELVTTTFLMRLVMTGVLGGSMRGGCVKGFVDTLLSWVVVLVMVFVRRDMDGKVRGWGRKHGTSGMKTAQSVS